MLTEKEKDFWAQKDTYPFKKKKRPQNFNKNKKKKIVVEESTAKFHPLGFILLKKTKDIKPFYDWYPEEKSKIPRLGNLIDRRRLKKRTFFEKRLDKKKRKLQRFYSKVKGRIAFRAKIREVFLRRKRKAFLSSSRKTFKHRKKKFKFFNKKKKLVFRGTKQKVNDDKKKRKSQLSLRRFKYYKTSKFSKIKRFRRARRTRRRELHKVLFTFKVRGFSKALRLQFQYGVENNWRFKQAQDEMKRARGWWKKKKWKKKNVATVVIHKTTKAVVKKSPKYMHRIIKPKGAIKNQRIRRAKKICEFRGVYINKIQSFRWSDWRIQKKIRRWLAHLRWRRRKLLNPRNIYRFRRKFGLLINKSNKVKRLLIRFFNFRNKRPRYFFRKRGFFFGLKKTAKRKYLMDSLTRKYKKKFMHFHKRLIRLYYENISPRSFWKISRTLRNRPGGLKFERSFLMFECRLSKILHRLGLSESVSHSRDLVMKGRVGLNGRIVRNHNYVIKPGDIFGIIPKYRSVFRRLYLSKISRYRSNEVSLHPVQFIESNYLLMLFGYIYYKFTEKYLVLPFNGRQSLVFGLGKRNL